MDIGIGLNSKRCNSENRCIGVRQILYFSRSWRVYELANVRTVIYRVFHRKGVEAVEDRLASATQAHGQFDYNCIDPERWQRGV